MIRLLVTGGTLDKRYSELDGSLGFGEASRVPDMLAQGRSEVGVTVETLFLKDSLDLDDEDRRAIVEACRACAERRVLITHGTDTVVETARWIAAAELGKTVVLVGAMIPHAFKRSDALFNLGAAVAAVQCLPAGVNVVMNGRVFAWDNVTKNRRRGAFEPLQPI
jgi:L-asparaginase